MYWLSTFVSYAERRGCQFLPEDIKFIRKRLLKVPETRQKATMKTYVDVWVGKDDEAVAPNVGRFRANSWLLEITNKKW